MALASLSFVAFVGLISTGFAALFVVGNFAAAFFTAATVVDALTDVCLRNWGLTPALDQMAQSLCFHPGHLAFGVACLVSIVTAAIYVPQFQRGLRDRGGVAPTFVAERRRRRGILSTKEPTHAKNPTMPMMSPQTDTNGDPDTDTDSSESSHSEDHGQIPNLQMLPARHILTSSKAAEISPFAASPPISIYHRNRIMTEYKVHVPIVDNIEVISPRKLRRTL